MAGKPGGQTAARSERRAHVLVVEDDARIAGMVTKGLMSRGFTVTVVDSGQQALDAATSGGFDVHLLDLGLPDIDGLEVLRRLRAVGCDGPVIVITARSDPRDREAALRLGARHYMLKPFSWAELWAAITDCAEEQAGP